VQIPKDLSEKVEALQNMLVSLATGGQVTNEEYKALRNDLLDNPIVKDRLPRFVRTCRDSTQFWQFIQPKFPTYRERRAYLWSEFRPILDALESEIKGGSPSDSNVSETFQNLNSDIIHEAWRRALERRLDDPEGAITAARSLLETVCKHILDDQKIQYDKEASLPNLYHLTASTLNLAPGQQAQELMKKVLGNVTAVVDGLGALRNILGDAHGKSMNSPKPEAHHAELAVNLSGAIASFLINTWETRTAKPD
jgi:hypothetical protein